MRSLETRRLRITIASRIFAPEPSAATFRLLELAKAFVRAGHEVTVLTTVPARRDRHTKVNMPGLRVRRLPVLRDRAGYVRGYAQYMSFDIPLFFRILFSRKCDIIVAEPPPTTGFTVATAAAIRRTPYIYYAADIWSDAAESTGAAKMIVRAVRWLERRALNRAKIVYSVNSGVSERIAQIAPTAETITIGNGVDTEVFSPGEPPSGSGVYAIYSGTASEWQGAGIFIEAIRRVRYRHPEARLIFLGQGSDWNNLQDLARLLPKGMVEFVDTVPPERAAEWIRGAVVSLASIRPETGYSFAFPTKVFASWGVGTPVVFAGEGSVREFIAAHSNEASLGTGCAYDLGEVVEALDRAFSNPPSVPERLATGNWARRSVSLAAVADRAVAVTLSLVESG